MIEALSAEAGITKDLLIARLISPKLPANVRKKVLVESAKEIWNIAEGVEDLQAKRALRGLAISYLITAVGFTIGVEVIDRNSEEEAIEFLALKSGKSEIYTCYVKVEEEECAKRLFESLMEYV